MLRRIWRLAVKESIQLARDRMMAVFIILMPVAQLVLLAQATGHGIGNLSLAIVDQDRSAASRALSATLDSLNELVWRYSPASTDEMAALIASGKAAVGVVIPSGYTEAISGRELPAIQVIVDGANSIVGSSAQAYVEGAIAEHARRLTTAAPGLTGPQVVLRTQARFNPGLKSRLFTIPAQVGFIIYQITLAVASLTFARERELGTLEQLLVTPLRPFELVTGKALLAFLVGGVDFLLMYWVSTRLFAVPMRGSFALLLGLSLLFVGVEIAIGVLVSSVSRNQQQAILYVFLLAVLDVAMSGYLVPVKNMPVIFRVAASLSPLQHYLVIIRAIMLKGAGIAVLWRDAAALAAVGAVAGLAALAGTRRILE